MDANNVLAIGADIQRDKKGNQRRAGKAANAE
jgi:hypothetical protein